MIEIKNKEKCSGCHACKVACPKRCIEMRRDKEGFLYPYVHEDDCIDCGACETVCPIISETVNKHGKPEVIAAINRNDDVRKNSSSGGIFALLASRFVEMGGVIFGAAFSEDCKALRHVAVSNMSDIVKLMGSKYLQSDIGNSYEEAKEQLQNGRYVYFTGTPCQIAGLYAYLGKDYERLYTQDLVCHGVPSLTAWRKYLEELEHNAGANVKSVSFRNKSTGWKTYSMQIEFDNGVVYSERNSCDAYMKGFIGDLYLRPSCHNCSFKTVERSADITLADFWGIEKVMPSMDDDNGTSCVLIHSQKGKKLLDAVLLNVHTQPGDLDFVIRANPAICKSAVANKNRNRFFLKIENESFRKTITKCLRESLRKKAHRFAKRQCRRIIKAFTNIRTK